MVLVVVSMKMQELKDISTLLQYIDILFMYKRCLKKIKLLCCFNSFWWNKLIRGLQKANSQYIHKQKVMFIILFLFAYSIGCSLWKSHPDPNRPINAVIRKKKNAVELRSLWGVFGSHQSWPSIYFGQPRWNRRHHHAVFGWGISFRLSEKLGFTGGWLSILSNKNLSMGRYFLVRWISASIKINTLFYITSDTQQATWIFTHLHIGRIDNKQDLKILAYRKKKQMVLWNPVSTLPWLLRVSVQRKWPEVQNMKQVVKSPYTMMHCDGLLGDWTGGDLGGRLGAVWWLFAWTSQEVRISGL